MKVIEAIKKTLILWDEEKYRDYIYGKSDLNMNLLFEIREDIYEDRYCNNSEKQNNLFGADIDFSDKDGCIYIIDKQQIMNIKLFNTKTWKADMDIDCKIKISDSLKTRIDQGYYYYINEFDHWISYLIVRYVIDRENNSESNVGGNLEEGLRAIREKISCVELTL